MAENKNIKSNFQMMASIFVIITGIFVLLSVANSITGRTIGSSGNFSLINLLVIFWGILIIAVGIWMWRKNDFHKSIFDE